MQVLIHALRYVNVKRSALNRIAKAEREGLCLACLEPLDGRVIRQCHERCVKATKRAIARGEFTEDTRVAEGKLGECKNGGRPPSNPVTLEAKVS